MAGEIAFPRISQDTKWKKRAPGIKGLFWKQKCESDRDQLNVPHAFTEVDMHAKWCHKVAKYTMDGLYATSGSA